MDPLTGRIYRLQASKARSAGYVRLTRNYSALVSQLKGYSFQQGWTYDIKNRQNLDRQGNPVDTSGDNEYNKLIRAVQAAKLQIKEYKTNHPLEFAPMRRRRGITAGRIRRSEKREERIRAARAAMPSQMRQRGRQAQPRTTVVDPRLQSRRPAPLDAKKTNRLQPSASWADIAAAETPEAKADLANDRLNLLEAQMALLSQQMGKLITVMSTRPASGPQGGSQPPTAVTVVTESTPSSSPSVDSNTTIRSGNTANSGAPTSQKAH